MENPSEKRASNTEIYCRGIVTYKLFKSKTWRGEVKHNDARTKYHQVKYDDVDEEQLTHDEVRRHLTPPKQDSATRYEGMEQKYWTEEQSSPTEEVLGCKN